MNGRELSIRSRAVSGGMRILLLLAVVISVAGILGHDCPGLAHCETFHELMQPNEEDVKIAPLPGDDLAGAADDSHPAGSAGLIIHNSSPAGGDNVLAGSLPPPATDGRTGDGFHYRASGLAPPVDALNPGMGFNPIPSVPSPPAASSSHTISPDTFTEHYDSLTSSFQYFLMDPPRAASIACSGIHMYRSFCADGVSVGKRHECPLERVLSRPA